MIRSPHSQGHFQIGSPDGSRASLNVTVHDAESNREPTRHPEPRSPMSLLSSMLPSRSNVIKGVSYALLGAISFFAFVLLAAVQLGFIAITYPTPEEQILPAGRVFHVAQYNILAKYLGSNTEPWFLLPLELNESFREEIMTSFYKKDNKTKKYLHNFTNAFGGLLSKDQMQQVLEYDRFFQWSSRGPKVIDEVRSWGADIFSVVEVDVYYELKAALSGYDSIYSRRPRPSSLDGSALFWRSDRFELVGQPLIESFKDWDPTFCCSREEPERDRAYAAAALRDRTDGRVVVVASMHLMRNPEDEKKDMLRAMEASQMMHRVSCLMDEHGASGLVVIGDFNAKPKSWTHLFLLQGWQACTADKINVTDVFMHEMNNGTEWCTSKTNARKEWIDYIMYSGSTIRQIEPGKIEKCPETPIPDETHPSDHLPVQAKLQFLEGPIHGLCKQRQVRPRSVFKT